MINIHIIKPKYKLLHHHLTSSWLQCVQCILDLLQNITLRRFLRHCKYFQILSAWSTLLYSHCKKSNNNNKVNLYTAPKSKKAAVPSDFLLLGAVYKLTLLLLLLLIVLRRREQDVPCTSTQLLVKGGKGSACLAWTVSMTTSRLVLLPEPATGETGWQSLPALPVRHPLSTLFGKSIPKVHCYFSATAWNFNAKCHTCYLFKPA